MKSTILPQLLGAHIDRIKLILSNTKYYVRVVRINGKPVISGANDNDRQILIELEDNVCVKVLDQEA